MALRAVSAMKALVNFARDLQKSGSDIVVEEDLADIFGRGRIESALEAQFKLDVLADTTITPLHPKCDIQLYAGPGPTVTRALRSRDQRYLSTVIQLSFLAWMHDRIDLTSSLVNSMSKRVQMDLPGANPDSSFEGVVGTLEACSSQTSSSVWSRFSQQVRSVLQRSLIEFQHHSSYRGRTVERLSKNILLTAMDYLYLVQSLPEDRKMVLNSEEGMIPLIV